VGLCPLARQHIISSLFKDPISVDHSGGTTANVQASLAGRYATALFELACDAKAVKAVEESLASVVKALGESADLRALTTSPILSRSDAKSAIAAVAKLMKLDALTTKTLGVLAENRRLAETAAVARAFTQLAAAHRGEVTAEVTSAHALTAAQSKALAAQLKARVGTDVAINSKIDPSILGGLTVKIGSQMIDSSIKTRLNTLAAAMKG
jgi:F-type H+-transporting ATPase subunit delta